MVEEANGVEGILAGPRGPVNPIDADGPAAAPAPTAIRPAGEFPGPVPPTAPAVIMERPNPAGRTVGRTG